MYISVGICRVLLVRNQFLVVRRKVFSALWHATNCIWYWVSKTKIKSHTYTDTHKEEDEDEEEGEETALERRRAKRGNFFERATLKSQPLTPRITSFTDAKAQTQTSTSAPGNVTFYISKCISNRTHFVWTSVQQILLKRKIYQKKYIFLPLCH